jgi:hypothetical protein
VNNGDMLVVETEMYSTVGGTPSNTSFGYLDIGAVSHSVYSIPYGSTIGMKQIFTLTKTGANTLTLQWDSTTMATGGYETYRRIYRTTQGSLNFAGAITARLAIAHANRVVLALSVNRGWTTFGVVDQDYVVPAPQLRAAHWELFDPDPLPMDVFDADRFGGDPFDNDFATISGARIVRRGVVSFNRVAYI